MVKPPLCFVLMPYGRKTAHAGRIVNFDRVYSDLVAPGVRDADLEPLRAGGSDDGGFIEKATLEGLVICEFAVADLTLANPSVIYELGVRHAVRPGSTVLVGVEGERLPIEAPALQTMSYRVDDDGVPATDKIAASRARLAAALRSARRRVKDSPVYELLDYLPQPAVDHEKTDLFRDRVAYSAVMKERLAAARKSGVDAVRAVEQEIGDIGRAEAGVLVDLMLSYRARSAWKDMIALIERFPVPVRETVMVQEQYALAMNRDGRSERAERVLLDLIDRRGPSSETYGILGRVFKDRWEAAAKSGDTALAETLLDKAIEAYRAGFESDWRDAYPGINAVTLMELREPPDERRFEMLPVVRYAVTRKVARGKPDYWDRATQLELAVLASDEPGAAEALGNALASVREAWEPETTARNIRLIAEAREKRGEAQSWVRDIEAALIGAAKH
jgi:hypothetical protein